MTVKIMSHPGPSLENSWLLILAGVALSGAINIALLLLLALPRVEMTDESPGDNICLVAESAPQDDTSFDTLPTAELTAQNFDTQSVLPPDALDVGTFAAAKLNGFSDREEGGTALEPVVRASGGGGGDGWKSADFGHIKSDDAAWAHLKIKHDAERTVSVASADAGKSPALPGTLARPGAGEGAGNGKGSGALASSGSGSGSGTGLNGADRGSGLGKAGTVRVSRNPQVLYRDPGIYPASARQNGYTGTVVLHLEVLEDGSVGRIDVHASSGYSDLDAAAMESIRRWRFSSAMKDGRPVRFKYSIPYTFNLTSSD